MKNQSIAAILMAAFAAPALADNFETQVFNNTPEQQVQVEELSQKEMKETEGAFLSLNSLNAAGAIMNSHAVGAGLGAVGGGTGYLLTGGRDAKGFVVSVASGAAGGAFAPVTAVNGALVVAPAYLAQTAAIAFGSGAAAGYVGEKVNQEWGSPNP